LDAIKALILLNKHWEEIGKDSYTIIPVQTCNFQTCYCNLKLKFKKIRKRSQAFTDVKSPWCKARKHWYRLVNFSFDLRLELEGETRVKMEPKASRG
jgi:hypothetical protein